MIIIGGILALYIYIYITRLASNEIQGADKSLAQPGRKHATAL